MSGNIKIVLVGLIYIYIYIYTIIPYSRLMLVVVLDGKLHKSSERVSRGELKKTQVN